MKPNDGGPAHPVDGLKSMECPQCGQGYVRVPKDGMSLRAHFTGLFVPIVYFSHWENYNRGRWGENADAPNHQDIVEDAISLADATIAELEEDK